MNAHYRQNVEFFIDMIHNVCNIYVFINSMSMKIEYSAKVKLLRMRKIKVLKNYMS